MAENTGRMDRVFMVSVLILTITGVVMVYSSTALMDLSGTDKGAQFNYLRRHLFALSISVLAMVAAFRTPLSFLRRHYIVFILVALILLGLVFVPGLGVTINGARRWIRLQPTTFQPSEFAKFAMVLFLAAHLADTETRREELRVFLKPVLVMVALQGLILLQPDFGGAASLAMITLAMLFVGGTPLRYLFSLSGCLIPVLIFLLREPYRLKRLVAFLDPWKDPFGSGFQLVQSFIALGNGGLTGVGLGESRQKLSFLPEVNTDFIFSLLGEELGLLGALLVVALFLTIFIRGMKISREAGEPFSGYLAMGLVLMMTVQAILNIMVVTGIAPTKGLPLPFLSYGGSSLLMNYIGVGVLLRISRGEVERFQTGQSTFYIRRRLRRARRLGRLA